VRALFLCVCASAASARLAFSQCPDGTPPPCAARPARVAAAAPTPTSVAVLYFDNLSRDSNDTYLADGLTEELITRLGQIERLQVKSRTAVQRYRGRPIDDPALLGRALGVAHLVSGSVRRGGGRLRVTVELMRAATGVRVWGDAFERSSDDLMAVEAEIAQAIAAGVGGRLAPAEQRSLTARPTANPEAYDRFLRGNYFIAQRAPEAARRAVAEYEAAVRLDPGFARALGRMGVAYGLFIDWGWPFPGLNAESLLARGSAAAQRALRLDSLSADAWLAHAFLLVYRNPTTFTGALPAFERAIALDPRNAETWHHFGGTLGAMGRDSAAVTALRRALELEPERAITFENLATFRYYERRYDEAEPLVDSGLAVDPQAYYLLADRASFALTRGDTTRARAAALAAVRARPTDYVVTTEPLLIALEARAGDTVAARAHMERLLGRLGDVAHLDYVGGSSIALGFVRIGDPERALAMLESVRPRGIELWSILRDPAFDPIRRDPRFQRLVEETRPPELPR
jgi:TolB-like protein/Tfp pilus assembly protein PilF